MIGLLGRRVLVVGALIAGGASASGCQLTLVGGGGTPCFVGTFTSLGPNIAAAVNASGLGVSVNVTAVNGGTLALKVTGNGSSGTWTLTGNQSFTVVSTASSPVSINGTVAVTALSGSGTYTADTTASTIDLAVSSLTVTSVTFTGTFNGHTVTNYAVPLDQLPVRELLGLDVTVQYSCGTGKVTFSIPVHHEDGSVAHVDEEFDDA